MGTKQLPWEVKTCAECIEPGDFERDPSNAERDSDIMIFEGFCDDDDQKFQSHLCKTCEEGLVPSHLPTEQVIRFIKNIFDKHDLVI